MLKTKHFKQMKRFHCLKKKKKSQEFGKMDSAKPSYYVPERIILITVTNERWRQDL